MKEEKNVVSVVVPVYNAKPYLRMCLDSIINQDYRNLQIIIVDDGSNDGSGDICDEYALNDSRIIVLHITNGGSVRARKEGLKLASGAYVGFVDADDYIEPTMFSVLVKAIDETNVDFVHSGYKEVRKKTMNNYVNFEKGLYELDSKLKQLEFLKDYFLNVKDGRTISYSIWSKIYKRELITECFSQLDDSIQFGEDAICLIKCVLKSKKVLLLPEALYNYRILDDSLSHGHVELIFPKQVSLCAEIVRELEPYKYEINMDKLIYTFLLSSLLSIIKIDEGREFPLRQFFIEDTEILQGKRVFIYGAGLVGQDICEQLLDNKITITGFFDKDLNKSLGKNIKRINPNDLLENQFDVILVAILSESRFEDIKKVLVEAGIKNEKIIWMKPKRYY